MVRKLLFIYNLLQLQSRVSFARFFRAAWRGWIACSALRAGVARPMEVGDKCQGRMHLSESLTTTNTALQPARHERWPWQPAQLEGGARETPSRQSAAAHTGDDRTSIPTPRVLGRLPFDLGYYRGIHHTSSPSAPPLSCTDKALSFAYYQFKLISNTLTTTASLSFV